MTQLEERIYSDTISLSLPDGRRVGQAGHDVARQFLLDRLSELNLRPFAGSGYELPYRVPDEPFAFCNLVGVCEGSDRSLAPILIGAHYDSVIDAPCSDDNATAVAVALSAVEALQQKPLRRDVIVALFDAEEPPFFHTETMGSTRFYEDHCGGINFACVIITDLIGHDVEVGHPLLDGLAEPLKQLLFVMGSESHKELPVVVERVAHQTDGLRIVATLNEYVGDMSDHHAFRLGGQPFLFLSCGQGKYYHTPDDTAEWVNFEKVNRVHQFVVDLAGQIDAGPFLGGAVPSDTLQFEVRMLVKAFGPLAELFGINQIDSREDIAQIASAIRSALILS